LKNYIKRNYGWNGFQRIYSLEYPYKTTDMRFHGKEFTTSFKQIWDYITKDQYKYPFLYPYKSKYMFCEAKPPGEALYAPRLQNGKTHPPARRGASCPQEIHMNFQINNNI